MKDERTEKLSQNLKKIRNENNLSTSQMAHILNVACEDYEKLEKGVLSDTLGVDILFYAEREFGIEAYKLLM